MDTLTSSSGPFALPLGTLIVAKVAPRNSIGLGAYSSLNTVGVLAQTAPLTPNLPTRNAASDQSTIIVDYPFSSGDDGGSTILSLNLQWDAATGGVTWTTLIGESPYSTTDSYTVTLAQDGSNEGLTYRFRMRALNIHGWSDSSVWAEVLAADVPGVVASTTIQLVDETQVQLSWQEPEANGSPVDAYTVEILSSTGSYVAEETHCGSTGAATIVTEAACTIPMSAFTEAPLLLTQGSEILFRVTAGNAVGTQAAASGT